MKNLLLIFIITVSCSSTQREKVLVSKNYKYEVRPTEDNSWTSSGQYFCDSIRFITANEAIIYTDGKQQKIFSRLIRVYQRF